MNETRRERGSAAPKRGGARFLARSSVLSPARSRAVSWPLRAQTGLGIPLEDSPKGPTSLRAFSLSFPLSPTAFVVSRASLTVDRISDRWSTNEAREPASLDRATARGRAGKNRGGGRDGERERERELGPPVLDRPSNLNAVRVPIWSVDDVGERTLHGFLLLARAIRAVASLFFHSSHAPPVPPRSRIIERFPRSVSAYAGKTFGELLGSRVARIFLKTRTVPAGPPAPGEGSGHGRAGIGHVTAGRAGASHDFFRKLDTSMESNRTAAPRDLRRFSERRMLLSKM